MGVRKSEVAARLPVRRGLTQAEAAMYVGLGASKFAQLVKDGRMPRPRMIDGSRVWDVDDLDASFRSLPKENEHPQDAEVNPWH